MQLPSDLSSRIVDSVFFEIFIYDKHGQFVFINKAAIPEENLRNNFFQKTEWELCDWYQYSSKIAENRMAVIEQVFNTGDQFQKEEIFPLTGSKKKFYLQTYAPIFGNNGEIEYVIRYANDISDRVLVQKEFEYLANHDPLTGLPNRRLFYHKLESIIETNEQLAAVILLDLDRFKVINDTLGHVAGDSLIRSVAGRLLQNIQTEQNTVLARLGGDEFAIAMSHVSDEIKIRNFANKVIQMFQEPFILKEHELFITTSVGVYSFLTESGNETPDSLIHKSDIAMYHAKEGGRNKFNIYLPGMESKTENIFSIETKIYRGLRNKEFSVDFQPKIDTKTFRIRGAEALIRWKKESKIPVRDFIQIAEGSKLINLLGNYVLDEVLDFLAKNKSYLDKKFSVAINLSENQFMDEEFIPSLIQKAGSNKVDLDKIEIEIKENIIMKNVDKSIDKINSFRKLGLKVAIDDYGSGSSSLSYLRNCPIDVINIDKSFISHINENYQDAAITGAIISMAQQLKIKVSAEGVETKEQLLFLNYLRCDYLQGFVFGQPMSRSEFEKYIQSIPDYRNLFDEE